MSSYIKKGRNFRRKRAREPMVDGDVDSAEAVTHTRIAEAQDDGSVIFKHVLESLDSPIPKSSVDAIQLEATQAREDFNDYNMSPPQSPRPRISRVSVLFLDKSKTRTLSDTKRLHNGIYSSY